MLVVLRMRALGVEELAHYCRRDKPLEAFEVGTVASVTNPASGSDWGLRHRGWGLAFWDRG